MNMKNSNTKFRHKTITWGLVVLTLLLPQISVAKIIGDQIDDITGGNDHQLPDEDTSSCGGSNSQRIQRIIDRLNQADEFANLIEPSFENENLPSQVPLPPGETNCDAFNEAGKTSFEKDSSIVIGDKVIPKIPACEILTDWSTGATEKIRNCGSLTGSTYQVHGNQCLLSMRYQQKVTWGYIDFYGVPGYSADFRGFARVPRTVTEDAYAYQRKSSSEDDWYISVNNRDVYDVNLDLGCCQGSPALVGVDHLKSAEGLDYVQCFDGRIMLKSTYLELFFGYPTNICNPGYPKSNGMYKLTQNIFRDPCGDTTDVKTISTCYLRNGGGDIKIKCPSSPNSVPAKPTDIVPTDGGKRFGGLE